MGDKSQDGSRFNLGRVLITIATPSLTAAALLVYLILRISYDRFYDSFRIATATVGLTYATILTESVGLVLWLLLWSVFWSLVALFWRWCLPRTEPLSTGSVRRITRLWLTYPL